MKRVKLMSLALIALSMVVVTAVNAQPQCHQQREPKSAEEMAKMMTQRMTKSLDLAEDQADKIYDINLKYAEERRAKVEIMKIEREEKRKERGEVAAKGDGSKKSCSRGRKPQCGRPQGCNKGMSESRKAMTKEIIAVLNDDQIVEYIEMQKRVGNHQKQGHMGRRHGAPRGGSSKQVLICKK